MYEIVYYFLFIYFQGFPSLLCIITDHLNSVKRELFFKENKHDHS